MKILLMLVSLYMQDAGVSHSFSEDDLVCATLNTWHEARGEDELGRLYVGQTVRNRLLRDEYPDTICGVVYAKGAFEWTEDNVPDSPHITSIEQVELMIDTIRITASALDGKHDGVIMGATDYFAHKQVTPCWEPSFEKRFVYGNHTWMFDRNEKTPCWDRLKLAQNP